MQILPTSSNTQSKGMSGMSSRDSLDFVRMISSYLDEPAAEVTPSLDLTNGLTIPETEVEQGALSEESASVADEAASSIPLYPTTAPYNSTDTTSKASSDVLFTSEEVNAIANSMQEQGADAAAVDRVRELAGNPAGVGMNDVIHAAGQEQPAALTDRDMVHIGNFLNKVDESGQLAESVMADLRAGKAAKAWTSISRAMDALPAGNALLIEKNEMLALGKALRLSDSTMTLLGKTFGNNEAMKLNPKGLEVLTAPVQHEITTRTDAQNKLVGQLEKALTPVLKTARKRAENEHNATSRETRTVQHSQTLIQDTVTRNGFARQGSENPVAAKEDAKNAAAMGKIQGKDGVVDQSQAQNQTVRNTASGQDANARGTASSSHTPSSQTSQISQTGPQTDSHASQEGRQYRQDFPGNLDAQQNHKAASNKLVSGDPWDALLNKLSAGSHSGSTGMVNSQQVLPGQTGLLQTARQTAALSARVVSQVEQGMLSALRDGSKRLELQLNPLDLGAMSVVLTTRNGEVSALLRPERGETAALLNQQLDQLKANLEQQGVKVEKVEVQTQLRDQNGTTWQGADQHNASQEQRARAQELERNRRLNRIGGDSSDGLGLARDLHLGLLRGGNGEQGLHLVA